MSSRLRGAKLERALPAGATAVVDESARYAGAAFWVGVIADHPRDPDGSLLGLPIVRLTARPAAASLTHWWVIGKAYQRDEHEVLTLDEARERFGDQPEFHDVQTIPGWCPNTWCVSRRDDATTAAGEPCPVCGAPLG